MGLSYKKIAQNSKASQNPKELEWLLNVVGKIQPKVILEIGVHQGYSCQVWKWAFGPEMIIGVENDPHDIQFNDFILLDRDSHDWGTKHAIEAELRRLGRRHVDFLFIDGDHSYKGVRADYELYRPLVRKGGIIAFHDAGLKDHPLVEVHRFWDEINDPTCDFFQDGGTGVGVMYV